MQAFSVDDTRLTDVIAHYAPSVSIVNLGQIHEPGTPKSRDQRNDWAIVVGEDGTASRQQVNSKPQGLSYYTTVNW